MRSLVWDAAAGLNERDRAMLDLHLRQGLEGAELGEAMGMTADNAYVGLSRLRDQVESSIGALLVARSSRRDCAELTALLDDWDGDFTPLVRKRVARHVDRCPDCSRRRVALASPAALLSGVPVFAAPALLRDRVLEDSRLVSALGSRSDRAVQWHGRLGRLRLGRVPPGDAVAGEATDAATPWRRCPAGPAPSAPRCSPVRAPRRGPVAGRRRRRPYRRRGRPAGSRRRRPGRRRARSRRPSRTPPRSPPTISPSVEPTVEVSPTPTVEARRQPRYPATTRRWLRRRSPRPDAEHAADSGPAGRLSALAGPRDLGVAQPHPDQHWRVARVVRRGAGAAWLSADPGRAS